MSRSDLANRFSELAALAAAHKETYITTEFEPFSIFVTPGIFSPTYFAGSHFFGTALGLLLPGRIDSFLEIGVGTGIVSLYVAWRSSSVGSSVSVVGVNIDPLAVNTARENFAVNNQEGEFFVSDIFDAVGERRFDCIFWHHPWAWHASQPEDERQPMFYDEGYEMLRRFLAQAKQHLLPGGTVMLGTSEYANLALMEEIWRQYGFADEVAAEMEDILGDGLFIAVFIVKLSCI